MTLTELLQFTADVQAQTDGINPDEVIVTATQNGQAWRKIKGLSVTLPAKTIKYQEPTEAA